jgi:putative two-component system response regulator
MKILIADDNLFYRRMLEATLVEWKYEVLAVNNGEEAWRVLQQFDAPQVAILDWVMPGMDGLEVCRHVRALQKPEPTYLMLLTSQNSQEDIVAGLQAGADDYLTKPFNREELGARLRVGLRIVGLQTSQTVIFTFARAVEARSPYTQGHAHRVAAYARALADRIGLSRLEKETLQRGAVVHDIGKIAIPDAILDKASPLTPEEVEVIKQHPQKGVQIVQQLHCIHDIIPLIRWHHERMDGRGYPDGLRGEEIPQLVRLLAVSDVYDALASKRPYRDAMPHAQCLQELCANAAGGGLDPELVQCFCDLPSNLFPDPPNPFPSKALEQEAAFRIEPSATELQEIARPNAGSCNGASS